jgi:hypothetical protein
MFAEDLRVTIQQIGGSVAFRKGQEAEFDAYKRPNPAAGDGWMMLDLGEMTDDSLGFAITERSDDYCATTYVYCRHPQPVARIKTELAIRDIGLLPIEQNANPDPFALDSEVIDIE